MVIRVVLVILSKMHSMKYQLSTQEILSITYSWNGLEIYTPKKIFHFEDRKWQMWEQWTINVFWCPPPQPRAQTPIPLAAHINSVLAQIMDYNRGFLFKATSDSVSAYII